MKILNFEGYLQEQFFKEEPQILDDNFPDAFNDWIIGLDAQQFLDYGDAYGKFLLNNKK